MIKSIKSLPKDKKAMVLNELETRGARSSKGHFIKYDYTDFYDLSVYLNNYYMDLDTNQILDFMSRFNPAEDAILRKIQNRSNHDDLKAKIRLANNRTRLAVGRILKGAEEKEQPKPPMAKAYQKIKSVFA